MKQYHQLCLILVNLVSHLSKTLLTGTVTELFSTLQKSVKHGRSASATARRQKCCASNLEKVGGEVPAPSVYGWQIYGSIQGTAGETLNKPRDDPRLMDKQAEKRLTRYLMRRFFHLF